MLCTWMTFRFADSFTCQDSDNKNFQILLVFICHIQLIMAFHIYTHSDILVLNCCCAHFINNLMHAPESDNSRNV